jgi:DNA-binding transcriptional MerR regulator
MSEATAGETGTSARRLTIGAVCGILKRDYPDISISKIRYLEDQKLLAPRRTRGGYRLYSDDDVERLRTILKLQRDEFLPLRVIREELARPSGEMPRSAARRRRPASAPSSRTLTFAEVCAESGAKPELVRELEEHSVITARDETYRIEDAQIAGIAATLAGYGVGARTLRAFYGAIQRESGLLEQLLSPALHSRNPDRRSAGLEEAETLAALTAELTEVVLLRNLRGIAHPAS